MRSMLLYWAVFNLGFSVCALVDYSNSELTGPVFVTSFSLYSIVSLYDVYREW